MPRVTQPEFDAYLEDMLANGSIPLKTLRQLVEWKFHRTPDLAMDFLGHAASEAAAGRGQFQLEHSGGEPELALVVLGSMTTARTASSRDLSGEDALGGATVASNTASCVQNIVDSAIMNDPRHRCEFDPVARRALEHCGSSAPGELFDLIYTIRRYKVVRRANLKWIAFQ